MIRIDLLGFGGSEKPESGYSIPEQASTVAEALNQLDVAGRDGRRQLDGREQSRRRWPSRRASSWTGRC